MCVSTASQPARDQLRATRAPDRHSLVPSGCRDGASSRAFRLSRSPTSQTWSMAWARSMDLRERVSAAYAEGNATYEAVAERFRLGRATVSRWLRLHRETGNVAPKAHRCGNPPKVDERGLSR